MLLASKSLDPCVAAAMASDRVEVDTARPFRSVKEAVAVFGERILVADAHSSRPSNANANANAAAVDIPITNHEASSSNSSSVSTTVSSPDAMEEEDDPAPAVVPMMYSAPSSPQSSPQSANNGEGDADGGEGETVTVTVMRSVKKLEEEVAETRQEVAKLRKRSSEMEMAVASLNAQLHRGLSKIADMESASATSATATARRSVGGDTDVKTVATFRSERWGGGQRTTMSCEYLPSFSHALSLGEVDDGELVAAGDRRRKARKKVKPIVPLIGDIIFSKRKSTKEKGAGDGFYSSGDLYV